MIGIYFNILKAYCALADLGGTGVAPPILNFKNNIIKQSKKKIEKKNRRQSS